MHDGKWHVAEKRFARQPDHDIGIFAQGPQHGQLINAVERLAKDKDALAFQNVEMVDDGSLSLEQSSFDAEKAGYKTE